MLLSMSVPIYPVDRGVEVRLIQALMEFDAELDTRGYLCPLPVLKVRKRLQGLPSGSVLRLVADDPAAVVDVPHFCRESGHEFLGVETDGDASVYLIRKCAKT